MAKAHLTDEKEIREAIARAEFVRKGKVFFFFHLILYLESTLVPGDETSQIPQPNKKHGMQGRRISCIVLTLLALM